MTSFAVELVTSRHLFNWRRSNRGGGGRFIHQLMGNQQVKGSSSFIHQLMGIQQVKGRA